MRNLLSAILAVTLLGSLGCESCWEPRDPAKAAAPAPSAQPAPAPAPPAAPASPASTPAVTAAAVDRAQLPAQAGPDRRAIPMRRFDRRELRLGDKRLMLRPGGKYSSLRGRVPAASTSEANPNPDPGPAPAPATQP